MPVPAVRGPVRGAVGAFLSIAVGTFSSETMAASSSFDQATPASASMAQVASPDEPWPDGGIGMVHWFLAGAFGSCARDDPRVGTAALCGELPLVGIDLPARIGGGNWHVSGEIGLGSMGAVTAPSDVGVLAGSGGGYGVARALVGYDVTRLYFLRVGAQLRVSRSLQTFTPGPMAVADVGVRLGDHVEIGLRGVVGFDGFATTYHHTSQQSLAFAFGTSLLARVFLP